MGKDRHMCQTVGITETQGVRPGMESKFIKLRIAQTSLNA